MIVFILVSRVVEKMPAEQGVSGMILGSGEGILRFFKEFFNNSSKSDRVLNVWRLDYHVLHRTYNTNNEKWVSHCKYKSNATPFILKGIGRRAHYDIVNVCICSM